MSQGGRGAEAVELHQCVGFEQPVQLYKEMKKVRGRSTGVKKAQERKNKIIIISEEEVILWREYEEKKGSLRNKMEQKGLQRCRSNLNPGEHGGDNVVIFQCCGLLSLP